jgi:hypothetical protein
MVVVGALPLSNQRVVVVLVLHHNTHDHVHNDDAVPLLPSI